MDINQWIEGLEHANPPSEAPRSGHQIQSRKRRRGSKTSSLLEPFANRDSEAVNHRQPIVSVGSSSPETSDAASTSTSSLSSSSSSSSSDKKYQRRPRHHTKADKYYLKSNTKSRPKKGRKKEKGKKPKHSRRKKHKSEAITGLVQTFKAKNVPKDRLTLDPVTRFGLYTKGRSSGPTRGKGLPDLVFSEMKFLQKPESSTKEESNPKVKKKSRKKKRRQASEKEISRYFDTGVTRPHDDEREQKRPTPPHDTSAVGKGLQPVSPVVSDLLEKPFLGFGSRGTHPPTTSYYSWSESGRESTAQTKHFAPDLEPLAAGQLQSTQARKQKHFIPVESDQAQRSSAEPVVARRHSKNQAVVSEHAREIDQATRPPAEPQSVQQADTEAITVPISYQHEIPVPAATTLANRNEERSNSTKRGSKVHEAALDAPNQVEHYSAESIRPRSASKNAPKQHLEPWEELLQNCGLAARPLLPTYYNEEDLARYNGTATQNAIQDQLAPATYGHADLRLWRTDVDDFPEDNYMDNAGFVREHVDWTQPEAIEYQEETVPSFEEMVDDDSESLDSEIGCDILRENGMGWEESGAKQHGAVPDYQIRDGETTGEFATFWQPNRLY